MNGLSLFERALGARFASLALQHFHRLSGVHELCGVVETEPPASAIGDVLARFLGGPRRAARGTLRLELDAAPDTETWTRHFPARTMRSRMQLGDGQGVERTGAARLVFALPEIDGGLRLRSPRFLGIPCPAWLRPRLVAEKTGDGQRLCFRVEAALAAVGRVVGYRGHLVVPDETAG